MPLNHPLNALLARQGFVVLDGGLATELEARGENLNDPLWSARVLLEAPAKVSQVHYDYLAAGADIVATASYQATIPGLIARGLSASAAESVLRQSVTIALEARDRFWSGAHPGRLRPLVAASIGPYGAYLHDGSEYRGDYHLTATQLKDFHRDRLSILASTGADLIACESFPSLLEAEAMADLLTGFPDTRAWISFTCRDGLHLSDRTLFSDAVLKLSQSPNILAIGINCTAPCYISDLLRSAKAPRYSPEPLAEPRPQGSVLTPARTVFQPDVVLPLQTSRESGKTAPSVKPLMAYPNSGECYDPVAGAWGDNSREDMIARSAVEWHSLGALLIGGCCRTTPHTIAAIRRALLSSEVKENILLS